MFIGVSLQILINMLLNYFTWILFSQLFSFQRLNTLRINVIILYIKKINKLIYYGIANKRKEKNMLVILNLTSIHNVNIFNSSVILDLHNGCQPNESR